MQINKWLIVKETRRTEQGLIMNVVIKKNLALLRHLWRMTREYDIPFYRYPQVAYAVVKCWVKM